METFDISVVIPTYNKKDFLELTLTALGLQTYPHEKYEVVIVNDGSTDDTESMVSSLNVPYHINYTHQENKGRSEARNCGIKHAKGETIIFIDDDCIPTPTFIENYIHHHRAHGEAVIIGYKYLTFSQMLPDSSPHKGLLMEKLNCHEILRPLRNIPVGTMFIRPQDFDDGFDRIALLSYAGERGRWEQAYETYTSHLEGFVLPWLFFTTGNVSVSKRHCVDVGGFDENFKEWGLEDFEIGYRLYKRGLRFVLDKTSVTYRMMHWDDVGEERVVSKLKNYIYFCQKHPHIEVFLHWLLSTSQLDILTYNELVRQYHELLEKASPLSEDYYRLVKHQCEYYGCNLEYRILGYRKAKGII